MTQVVLPPHDEEAEEAVLGSLLIDPSAIAPVASYLKPEDFYLTKNGWVYEVVLALGDRTDLFTVARCLAERNQLTEIGGEVYLAQLTTGVYTALNVQAYAQIVKRKALSRRLIQAASAIAKDAWTPDLDADALIDRAQSALIKAVTDTAIRREVTLADAIDKFWTDFETTVDTGVVPGIPTGISAFDHKLTGWRPGRLTVFGALPGHGKTTIMLNLLLHAARKGYRGVILSLEQNEEDLVEAIAACESGVDLSPEAIVKLNPTQKCEVKRKVQDGLARILQMPLHPVSRKGASPADLVYEVKRISAQYGPVGLAAFDYIQLGKPNVMNRQFNREQEVGAVAQGLKEAAMELGIHVFTASQVNADGETRESKAITQHADTVIYLKEDTDYPPKDPASMLPLKADFWKNRKGKTGAVGLMFHKAIARIAAMEVRE
ncbi:MAG: hypothetical protein IT323_13660 [Anaerolineae bacterium]|nr:hypothetical protein [Anaerolineae bacterium]